ncbi:MAG: CBS domain-containing protein [Rhodospirillaceae bacterium]|jgi:CBS domain-containing protein|nr:CBS domain-containing protein [Rhodospirillaceae bacterium]MBT3494460.1 CBS domain-containing protein [Rhodospirillaceae bacterium]MBT3778585.1 CBS domain-containing protein [Rhodospirillaceae bacterium]MBT3978533.1 CBS domain-containing protein [Rhodospirillaceae bacterium]MBT4171351.1 CBS domain-containing protein [Rhodospirillaceae bacterium]
MPYSHSTASMAFRQLAGEHMQAPPPTLPLGARVDEAVALLASAASASLVIVDDGGILRGVLTEQDVVRRIAFKVAGDSPLDDIMSQPVRVIRDQDLMFHAIARMRQAGLRHMPVVNDRDCLVGMLTLDGALAQINGQLVAQIESLTRPDTPGGMAEVRAAQLQVAEQLFADEVPTPEIQALVSHINNDVYRRMTRHCIATMAAEGLGEPPREFCLIVMGSGGRQESYLNPDQDNGLIIADYPDTEHDRIDGYFSELADRLTKAMDGAGMPLCNGYVMAVNPLWRKTARQWRAQMDYWLGRRNPAALRLADIFFDFRGVAGERRLAAELRDYITDRMRNNRGFMREMYLQDEDFGVALGLFNRFIVEKNDKEHRGELNLKITGTLPLVDAVRALALLHGVAETGTLARIAGLLEQGALDRDEADYLQGAFAHITHLLLRQQMVDQRGGKTISNYVHPDRLTDREDDRLVDALKAIRDLRDRLRSDLGGALF